MNTKKNVSMNVKDTVITNSPSFAFIPVRTIKDYSNADFIAVCHYFRNSPFTYKFLGLEYKSFRVKAINLKCWYPSTLVTEDGKKVKNPNFNNDVPKLNWVPCPYSDTTYVIDVEVTDEFIKLFRNSESYKEINKSETAVAPVDKAENFLKNLDTFFDNKLQAMEMRLTQKMEQAIGFKLVADTPEFKAYMEYKDGTSETFQDFCRFKVFGPTPEIKLLDERAKAIGYPTHAEFTNLMRNYESYIQIAKAKNVSTSLVNKWAAFWKMPSEGAKRIAENNLYK